MRAISCQALGEELSQRQGALGKDLQVQKTESAKGLGKECVWCFQKTATRPCGYSKKKGLK